MLVFRHGIYSGYTCYRPYRLDSFKLIRHHLIFLLHSKLIYLIFDFSFILRFKALRWNLRTSIAFNKILSYSRLVIFFLLVIVFCDTKLIIHVKLLLCSWSRNILKNMVDWKHICWLYHHWWKSHHCANFSNFWPHHLTFFLLII